MNNPAIYPAAPEHKGVVLAVYGRSVEVRMTVDCSCEGCKALVICGEGEEEGERTVTVWSDHAALFQSGEEVVVSVAQAMGVKAVMWSYVVPAVVMVAILVGGKSSGASDGVTGSAALGAAAVYYFGLWLLRRRIEKVVMFKIRKL